MNYDEDDEDNVLQSKEPQVTAAEPGERKAARALRIKKRQEAIKRAEQPPEEAVAEEEPGVIEQTTAAALALLQRLALDGSAMVTNVKVTTDQREVTRRNAFFDKMAANQQAIEEEAACAQTQYEAITANWDAVLRVRDPLDIDAAVRAQREDCDRLLQQKDQLIRKLKDDLKSMDQAYHDDLEMQDNDIKELGERVERQVTHLQRAFQAQAALIERAVAAERCAALELNGKRWEALYRQRDKEALLHMDQKIEQLEAHKQNMDRVMWEHYERYRQAKAELEQPLQELTQDLEKLKATCLINTEKIGYNYQVLRKREEENVFVRSQQKRRLNKMSDAANALRRRIRLAAGRGAAEEARARLEIDRLMDAMADIERKAVNFTQVNNSKFTQVWRMSAARCAALAAAVRRAEVCVHAHVLSEPAPPPPPPPPVSPLAAVADNDRDKQIPERDAKDQNMTSSCQAKERLVRHILGLIADNTGFLIEERLFSLLEDKTAGARDLCTLDAIFMALEIESEADVELLGRVFLKYAFCPECLDGDSHGPEAPADPNDPAGTGVKLSREKLSMHRIRSSVTAASRSHLTLRHPYHVLTAADQQMVTEAEDIVSKLGVPLPAAGGAPGEERPGSAAARRARGVVLSARLSTTQNPNNQYTCAAGHSLEIEPMQVLTALDEFMSVFVSSEKNKLNDIYDGLQPVVFSSASRDLPPPRLADYWQQWAALHSPEKDRFWDGMIVGLNNYLEILQERSRLHCEVSCLRQRNMRLRRLAAGALPRVPPPPPAYRRAPARVCAPVEDRAVRLPPIAPGATAHSTGC